MGKLLSILIPIGLIVGLVFIIIFFIGNSIKCNKVVHEFKTCNVVVDGKKGSGKDLVFQYVINHRKDDYYSNISYGGKFNEVHIKDISVSPNTYLNFIDDRITQVPRTFREKKDIYISDGGIYLPSYMDSTLYKKFPSLPIYYALSRHLYNSNIHVNVQNFPRLWKALREQADFFVHTHHTFKLFNLVFITKVTCYDKLDSATKYLSPIKTRITNSYSKAQADTYNATNGDIYTCYLIQFRHSLKYNTRAFETKVLSGKRIK